MDNFELVDILMTKQYHISFAESCTGGLLASRIVDVPNASAVLRESYVTYANEAKEKILGVNAQTIEKFGVVSEEVAVEMVNGLGKISGADCCIATTGVAGPSGGTIDTPVGMICFGFKAGNNIMAKTMYFPNTSRNDIREKAVTYAIKQLLAILKQ